MRTYEQVLTMLLCFGCGASVSAWTQQTTAPVSAPAAAPQSTTPVTPDTAPPAPPVKKKKKDKPAPVVVPETPVAPEDMCLMTFHTEVYGQGAISSVNVDVSPMGAGTKTNGRTGPGGEFQTKLAPGDYQITSELGQNTARQNIHVPKGGSTLVMIEMPAPPQPSIPSMPQQPSQFPR
jgi:hypothetical protein